MGSKPARTASISSRENAVSRSWVNRRHSLSPKRNLSFSFTRSAHLRAASGAAGR